MILCEFGGGTDSDIIWSTTPTAMINRLLPIVRTDAVIANYVNEHFGTKIPASRIRELRALREAGSKKANPDNLYSLLGEPIGLTSEDRKRSEQAAAGSLALARAIRAAHPDKAVAA